MGSVGTSAEATLVHSGYILSFELLPGAVYWAGLRRWIGGRGSFLLYAASLGILGEMTGYHLLLIVGLQEYFAIYLVIPILIAFLIRKEINKFTEYIKTVKVRPRYYGFLGLLAATVAYATLDGFTPIVNRHHVLQTVNALAATKGWPLPNLMMADLNLAYNYLLQVHVAAIHTVTKLPVEVLAARFVPTVYLLLLMVAIIGFARRHARDGGLVAALVILQCLWIIQRQGPSWWIAWSSISQQVVLIPSRGFALALFLISVDLITRYLRRQKPGGAYVAGLTVLSFAATGVRGILPPIILCTLGGLMAYQLLFHRRLQSRAMIAFLVTSIGFMAGKYFFFHIGKDIDTTQFMSISTNLFEFFLNRGLFVVAHSLADLGVPVFLAGLATLAGIILLQAGFLSPALAYQIGRSNFQKFNTTGLLLGAAVVTGFGGMAFTQLEHGSHSLEFLLYSHLGMALIGAVGLRRMGREFSKCGRRAGLISLGAGTIVLAAIQVGEVGGMALRKASIFQARSDGIQLWNAPRPDLVVETLQRRLNDDAILLVVDPDETFGGGRLSRSSMVFVVETEGMQYFGTLRLLNWYVDWSDEKTAMLRRRHQALRKVTAEAEAGRLSSDTLVDAASSLGSERRLFVVVPRDLRVGLSDFIKEVMFDEHARLYIIATKHFRNLTNSSGMSRLTNAGQE